MAIDTALSAPLNIGVGKYICPPTGWSQEGFITGDNPYWLLPKSRLRWVPPGDERPALHWHLSATPLPDELMARLLELVRGAPGPVASDRLAALYPGLIRMPLDSITSAEIVTYPKSGRLLRVEYAITQYGEVGIVHYAPTEMYEFGEFQMLAYEGKDPGYSKYLQTALNAMESFATGQGTGSEAAEGDEPHKSGRLTAEIEALLPWNIGDEGASESMDFTPEEAKRQVPPPEPAPKAPPAEPPVAETPPAKPVAEAPPPEPARAAPPEQPTAPPPAKVSDEASGKSAEEGAVEHILKQGETIRTIVQERWPDLDTDAVMKKVRDIYAFNLARGNKLEAFGLKAGARVLLPEE